MSGKRKSFETKNYRLDKSKSPIDAAAQFAFSHYASIHNEVQHGKNLIPVIPFAGFSIMAATQGESLASLLIAAPFATSVILNGVLIFLQRYNRARAIRVIDKLLQRGETFSDQYQNWTGIDNRAINSFRDSQVKQN